MHVDRIKRRHRSKSGEIRDYESRLLRRSFRKPDGSVGKETLANLSMLPPAAVDAIEAVLKGSTLVAADAALAVTRSRPHGHVALVHSAAQQLGLPGLLGPAGRSRDLAYGLVVSRVVAPAPDQTTLAWWADVTLGVDLGIDGARPAELDAAKGWLLDRQGRIEAALASPQLRTAIPADRLDAAAVITAYQDLGRGGPGRVGQARGQFLVGLLAARLGWQLRRTLAPLTGTGAPGQPLAGWNRLLEHLGTLTRSTIRVGSHAVDVVSDPTPTQRRAFSLVGMPIPGTLKPN